MGFTKKEMEEQGFSPEQVAWAMSERGKEKELDKAEIEKFKISLSEKENSIKELNEQIKMFDGTDSELKDLRNKVATYEKGESERIEAEKQAKINQELLERFSTIKGEQKFNHDLVEKGRFEEFKKALTDEQFKGKGDSDIFQAIVKPEDLANPQQAKVTMPGGNASHTQLSGVEEAFLRRNPTIKI